MFLFIIYSLTLRALQIFYGITVVVPIGYPVNQFPQMTARLTPVIKNPNKQMYFRMNFLSAAV